MRAKFLCEAVNFTRGLDPKKALSLGLERPINDVSSEELKGILMSWFPTLPNFKSLEETKWYKLRGHYGPNFYEDIFQIGSNSEETGFYSQIFINTKIGWKTTLYHVTLVNLLLATKNMFEKYKII